MFKELPALCQGEHHWVPLDEIVLPTCGAFAGADVVSELMVISSSKGEAYQPRSKDVCTRCFQVYGQEEGIKDQRLVDAFRILNDLQSPPPREIRVSEPYISPSVSLKR